VALLSAPEILEIDSPLLFVCPLSSRSEPGYASLQCRLAAARRPEGREFRAGGALPRHQLYPTLRPPIARLTESEIEIVLHRLMRLVGL
jgi:mRNA interferase MazF